MFSKKYVEALPSSEKAAYNFEKMLHRLIRERRGQFLRDEGNAFHVVVDGTRISINQNRDNHGMADLMIKACGVTTHSAAAHAAIQRLQVVAARSTDGLRLRRFSALSDDGARLYIPVGEGGLLQVTADAINPIQNGSKPDLFWLEHPNRSPLVYSEGDLVERLAHFERLLVETQACALPEMKWFVAMAEGLFPFIRDAVVNRLIVVHLGPSQSGKTSGAKRFTLLHGLGDVKGDYSVAALGNMPDPGLLVLDNKEQSNFAQPLIDTACSSQREGSEPGPILTAISALVAPAPRL